MATTTRTFGYVAIGLLLLCLALVSCDAAPLLRVGRGGRLRKPRVAGGLGRMVKPVGSDVAGPGETIFNVLQYGAKSGGVKDNTQAFMKAWNAACHTRGKARLLVPQGEFLLNPVIFQGPCSTSTPIIVQIVGTLKATTDVSAYTDDAWIQFEAIDGLIVTGGGILNGQGASFWKYNDCSGSSYCANTLKTGLRFNHVKNGIVRGISSKDSAGFHIVLFGCENFRAQRLSITAPENSPNTDGIHISNSTNIKISKSVIGTGDDCISIGQGSINVRVNKITCGPGHGISVGSLGKVENEGDVKGITVKNCTLKGTTNGLRIKTWSKPYPSQASSMIFENIIMDNVKNPIIIDQTYCEKSKSQCSTQVSQSQVKISSVYYQNIRGTTASDVAVSIVCSKQFPCQNVQLNNINLKHTGVNGKTMGVLSSECKNAKLSYGGMQIPSPCRQ